MKDFKNILVVRTDRIGDVVLTTPVLKILRQTYPKARITMMVGPKTSPLVEGNPYLDEVIVDENHKSFLTFWGFVGQVRQKKFDCAIILHTKQRTNAVCFLAGIPYRTGYRNEKYGFFLNHGLEDKRQLGLKHEVRYSLDVLAGMDIPVTGDIEMLIPLRPQAEEWARQWLKDQVGLGGAHRLIALHIAASDPQRIWPVDNFIELAARFVERYSAKVLLIGSNEHRFIGEQIAQNSPQGIFNLCGKTTIDQLASLLKRCDVVISTDSGPAHIGAAVGCPVVCLFLRNQPGVNPNRWHPFTSESYVLTNQEGKGAVLDAGCTLRLTQNQLISPQDVLAVVEEIFKKKSGPARG